jgi:hypothetical protein
MTEPEEVDPAKVEFAQFITELSKEFDDVTFDRHKMGAEKYGAGKFLTVDTITEALEEIADFSNYMRYTYIRLRLLQERIFMMQAENLPEETVPITGFIKSSEATAVRPPKE